MSTAPRFAGRPCPDGRNLKKSLHGTQIYTLLLFMRINNKGLYKREIDLNRFSSSLFLFGPRLTGKTHLLTRLKADAFYDLLDPELDLRFRVRPQEFWEEISLLKKGARVIVDEIQKCPELLNYVQMGIERKKIQFLLSGSSARKLKRGQANLLGGRAIPLTLHGLTVKEQGADFHIDRALCFGSLPLICSLLAKGDRETAIHHLKSYVRTYIREEIQMEALVRKLSDFHRFLNVAGQCNAQMIEFANISRECAVHVNTVKEHYSILEDTLTGQFVYPFNRSERKKARPKFYFFDCGVVRALMGSLTAPPGPEELGRLFETWVFNELIKIRDYEGAEHRISLWRKGRYEVDFLIESAQGPLLAVECKSGRQIKNQLSLRAFRQDFPKTELIICSLRDRRARQTGDNIRVEPYNSVLQLYRKMAKNR